MRGTAPVPEPVCDPDGDVAMFSPEIAAALRQADDGLRGCVVCQLSTIWVWPVGEVAVVVAMGGPTALHVGGGQVAMRERRERVVPEQWAALPDLVGLHPTCVPGLLGEQASIQHGDDDPVVRAAGTNTAAAAAPTAAPTGSARRTGAYGRRRRTVD